MLPTMNFTYPLVIGDVARAVNLSTDRVRQLDDVLKPQILPNGHRRYSPQHVQAFVAKRTARVTGSR